MLFPILAGLAATAGVGLALNAWAERRLLRPDRRYPRAPEQPAALSQRRLVCVGDSLTHGNMSASYVEPLAARLAGAFYQPGWQVLNAGINADLTETLLARLDDVIRARPTAITLLIGSNDVNATLSAAGLNQYRRLGKLRGPARPSVATFEANLTTIVRRLRAETSAPLALLSLPPISEDLDHEANRRAELYSQLIKQIAQREGVAYLPLRERLLAELRARPGRPRARHEQTTRLVRLALLRHYALGQSWDRIATSHGCRFLTDNLHLNAAGARIVEELIAEWLATGL